MNEMNEKIPDPKELEKELGDFLAKKFGGNVKLATPIVMPQAAKTDEGEKPANPPKSIDFDLKPQDLISYLDQYVVKQTAAKDILATKICTHFNRVAQAGRHAEGLDLHDSANGVALLLYRQDQGFHLRRGVGIGAAGCFK